MVKIRRTPGAALAAGLAALVLVAPAAAGRAQAAAPRAASGLPLGAYNLPETRRTSDLAPGVTWTHIERGRADANDRWTVEVDLLRDEDAARALADRLAKAGFPPTVTRVDDRPQDLPSSLPWGWRVRVGSLTEKAAAAQLVQKLRTAGFNPSRTYFTGEDGRGRSGSGPWVVDVLKVDAAHRDRVRARQSLDRVPGAETVAEMVKRTGGIAGINGGYGSDEEDGTFGDMAGLSVINGELVSEAVNGRSALVLPVDPDRRPSVRQFTTDLRVRSEDGADREVDGINRQPGKIRNCGGVGGDLPTERPLHDVQCTDDSEIIQYTGFFYGPTHEGAGAAAVVAKDGTVLELRDHRGGAVPAGTTLLAGTGDGADWLRDHARPGSVLTVTKDVNDAASHRSLRALGDGPADIVSGGPQLLRDGRVEIPSEAEGFDHPDDPGFFDYFSTHRHPRTIAGVTEDGSLLLITVDGRRPGYSEGLSFRESALVARSLGAVDAINLDGGGSTTMVVGEKVVNRPSDATGPRQMATALIVR
ncbi:phosphodiester glycosidase family protein [Streptomyces sp. NPDC049585]|uniref:phosphodiester glycosidase family protein n=1 Tax=Streptomyces sp. NPDC049585 TaxID=3155154 RepID=UPI003418E0D5